MARSWFYYTNNDPAYANIASNYSATMGNPVCSLPNPTNICAVLATVSITQPVLTLRLQTYLLSAVLPPMRDQPSGSGLKKYVYVKAQ